MDVNIENIINIVVAVCTVFTLTVIWLTLKEMQMQRKKLYEPFIYLLKCVVIFQYEYPFRRFPFKNVNNIEDLKKENIDENDGYFELINLGEGLAKEIKIDVNWNIDYKEVLQRLKEEIEKFYDYIEIMFYESTFSISICEDERIKACNQCSYDYSNSYQIDYMIPTKINNESVKITFPTSLKLLLTLFTMLIEKNKIHDSMTKYKSWIEELNKIDMKITYIDNLGKKYKNNYKLGIKTPHIQGGTEFINFIYSYPIEREKNVEKNDT